MRKVYVCSLAFNYCRFA